MALLRKLNINANAEMNTGFGVNSSDYGGRFVNKDGEPNIEKTGIGFFEKMSLYHTLLKLPAWKFFSIIFISFIAMNLLFAVVYYLIGIDHLNGIAFNAPSDKFLEAFFFSCQTFTTVGYGRINPVGFLTSAIASFEALTGLLSFALVTGLLYGRFARPKAYLKFSQHALLSPYRGITAVMFRVAPFKNATLVDAEVKVSLGITLEEDGKKVNKFYPLPLEISNVNALTLSWTIVHPIIESSPLYGFAEQDFSSRHGEILVYIKAFDNMFSNTVIARTSYTFSELVIGAKFVPMFTPSEHESKTILQLDKLNSYTPADISNAPPVKD